MRVRTPRSLITVVMAGAAATLIAGCASTQVQSSWKDPEFRGSFRNIVVFVAARDEATRRIAEDSALGQMPQGVRVSPSHTLFPQQSEISEKNADNIRRRLTDAGIDGALVVRLVAQDAKQVYVAPQVVHSGPRAGLAPPHASFYRYGAYAYGYGYVTPAYSYETRSYVVESMLFRVSDARPVWTLATESRDPDSRARLISEVARIVGDELGKSGLLAAGK